MALQQHFEKAFDRFREAYGNLLGVILEHRVAFVAGFLSFCVASWLLVPFAGQNFFPAVDAGTLRLHVRAPTGTRIEQTAKLVDEVEAAIRREIPAKELEGRDLRAQSPPGRNGSAEGSMGSRDRPFAPSDHDGDGDDHRHVTDGAWSR